MKWCSREQEEEGCKRSNEGHLRLNEEADEAEEERRRRRRHSSVAQGGDFCAPSEAWR